MTDFSHLQKYDVTAESEAEFVFEDIKGEPSIWFRPMTDANEEYLNARIRFSVERAEKDQKGSKAKRREKILSTDRLKEDRDMDRVLMANTCAIRWGNPPLDKNGDVPEFTKANCLAFFRALPDYMFDPCRGFVSNVYNFVAPDDSPAIGDADDLGNATPSG